MSLLIDFSVFPLDKGDSVSPYVARVGRLIRESGLPHKFGPMGTAIEGDWEDIAPLLSRCFAELGKDCDRIYFTLKGDLKKGKTGRMESKVQSLEAKL
jgi:uncharacterized protein (TIGR00106 family)